MKMLALKLAQFLEYYLFALVLTVVTGTLVVWDSSYLSLAVWEVVPRACAVVLPVFAGLINIFRIDNKVLLIEFKVKK